MPRPQGGSSNRSTSGHSYSNRTTSGHRMNAGRTSRPGSGQTGSPFSSGNRPNTSFSSSGPAFGRRQPGYNRGYQGPGRSSFLPGFLLGSMMSKNRSRGTGGIPPVGPAPVYNMGSQPPRRRNSGGVWLVLGLIFLVLIFGMFSCSGCSSSASSQPAGSGTIAASTYNREKISNPNAFNADCIVDEEGFFEEPSRTAQRLKTFYDKTGIQPYVVIQSYDPSLKTDAQKEQYAIDYYDKYIPDENTLLYMYFADADPSSVGYMQTVNGKNIESVMDSQARQIFWDYMDSEWTSDQSTDDLFVNVFDSTADRIMTKTTTSKDVTRSWLWVLGIAIVAGAVIAVLMMKHRRDKEKAEETQRILETPLQTDDPDDDDLVHRYGG